MALHSLELIITNCKARIRSHHAEILRGTVTCWRYLRNQDTEEIEPIRTAIKRVTKLLMDTSPEAEMDMQAISDIDDYFAELAN